MQIDRAGRFTFRLRRAAGLALMVGVACGLAQRVSAQTAERWDPAILKFEEQDKVSPPPQNGIVFIGASSIVRWNLPEYFPELGANAINRGFGGSQSVDSVRYVDRIVTPYKPRIVVYYAGDNDVEALVPAAEIAHQFELFEQKVHAKLPQTKVIFITVKPSIRRFKFIDAIRETNRLVKEYAKTHPNVAVADIEQQMLGPDGQPNPEYLVADGLHMTPAGYKMWTATLKPMLK